MACKLNDESGERLAKLPARFMEKTFEEDNIILKSAQFDTILGQMIAIGNENALYLLEFADRRGLEHEIKNLKLETKATIIPGNAAPIDSIKTEIKSYFDGKIMHFETPLQLLGSNFQKMVWQGLMRIPYGATRSYLEQATLIGKPKACRAVANANGANQLAIIIPCHRIINSNGNIGGYGGGVTRKKWLLDHEKKYHNICLNHII